MNLSQRTSLSLLFVSLSTVSAKAALAGDNGSLDVPIENSKRSASLQPLDQLLGGDNHDDLFGSVLKQHEDSARPSKTTMEGHFDRDGSVQPVGQAERMSTPSTEAAQPPNLSLKATSHSGAESETSPASAASASSAAPAAPLDAASSHASTSLTYSTTITPLSQFTYTTTITPASTPSTPTTPASPVPLPAAGLLLASGLIGAAGLRKRQRQE
jgi:hypothetical protein